MIILLQANNKSYISDIGKTIRVDGFKESVSFSYKILDGQDTPIVLEFIKHKLGTKVVKFTTRKRQRQSRKVGFRPQYSIFRIVKQN